MLSTYRLSMFTVVPFDTNNLTSDYQCSYSGICYCHLHVILPPATMAANGGMHGTWRGLSLGFRSMPDILYLAALLPLPSTVFYVTCPGCDVYICVSGHVSGSFNPTQGGWHCESYLDRHSIWLYSCRCGLCCVQSVCLVYRLYSWNGNRKGHKSSCRWRRYRFFLLSSFEYHGLVKTMP